MLQVAGCELFIICNRVLVFSSAVQYSTVQYSIVQYSALVFCRAFCTLFTGKVPPPATALQPALLPPGACLPVPAPALPPRQSPAPWPVLAHGHEGSLLDGQQEPRGSGRLEHQPEPGHADGDVPGGGSDDVE